MHPKARTAVTYVRAVIWSCLADALRASQRSRRVGVAQCVPLAINRVSRLLALVPVSDQGAEESELGFGLLGSVAFRTDGNSTT